MDLVSQKIAHIKVSPGDELAGQDMKDAIKDFGFEVFSTVGEWSHFNPNHQSQLLQDLYNVFNKVNQHFILHQEDDFPIHPITHDLEYHLKSAIELLTENRSVMQVSSRATKMTKSIIHSLESFKNWNRQNDIYSFKPHLYGRIQLS